MLWGFGRPEPEGCAPEMFRQRLQADVTPRERAAFLPCQRLLASNAAHVSLTPCCPYSPPPPPTHLQGFSRIPHYDNQQLMEALYTRGPLAVSIDASQPSFRFYSGGVSMSSATQLAACCRPPASGHLAVPLLAISAVVAMHRAGVLKPALPLPDPCATPASSYSVRMRSP